MVSLLALLGCLLAATLTLRHQRNRSSAMTTGKPNGFSAELVLQPNDHQVPRTVYVKGLNVRRERADSMSTIGRFRRTRGKHIEIVNAKANAWWAIDPESKTYEETAHFADEQRSDYAETLKSQSGLIGVVLEKQAQHLGAEIVNGYLCEKLFIEETTGGETTRTTRWHSGKLNFDVKKQVVVLSRPDLNHPPEEYRITECYLPDSLFELPKGYKKVGKLLPPGVTVLP